jgi:hypothetical protein
MDMQSSRYLENETYGQIVILYGLHALYFSAVDTRIRS